MDQKLWEQSEIVGAAKLTVVFINWRAKSSEVYIVHVTVIYHINSIETMWI